MSHIESTIHIERPIDTVFEFITTPGNWPQWHPSSLSVEGATDHSLNVGEQLTEAFRVAGRRGRVVWTVREQEAPHRWVIDGVIVGHDTGGAITYALSPNASGTLLTRTFDYPEPTLYVRLLNRLFIERRVRAESITAVQRLKRLLEAGSAEAGERANEYYFLDQWFIQQPLEAIWQRIVTGRDYPHWWDTVYDEVQPLDDLSGDQVGARARVTAHGKLPYRIHFESKITHVDAPYELGLRAEGDLTGTGVWRLTQRENGVAVTFEWIVRADKPIIRLLSPVLKPLFAWNHRWTMQQGELGLKRVLEQETRSAS